jgi:hypothetical protein
MSTTTTAYRQLDSDRIVETVHTLSKRIHERFPQAGLNSVCKQLLEIARQAKVRAKKIAEPMVWLRTVSWAVVVLIVLALAWTIYSIHPEDERLGASDAVQMLEAGFNSVLLIGATILFLVTLETRVKRGRALKALHELRVVAHIIDMHQLTKDPERAFLKGPDTQSSPKRTMTGFELNRYLDYCSEMLAMLGKVAALYAQEFEDAQVTEAASDIEDLTSGLSRKIWQKIVILHSASEKEPS